MTGEWSRTTRYLVAIGLVLFGILVVWISGPVIRLLIIAALAAYLVRPIILFLERRVHLGRRSAVAITYLGIGLIFIVVPFILAPALVRASNGFLSQLSLFIQDGQNACQQLLEQLQTALPAVQGATAPLIDLLEKQLPLDSPILAAPTLLSVNSYFGFDLKFIAGAVGQVVSFLVNMAFVFMASIYLSIDGDRFVRQIVTAAPVGAQSDIALLAERISVVWNSFFRGQITIMIVIGIVVWLGNLALGTPGAIFLGFFAGLMEVVPILGPVVAAIPAVIAAVVSGSSVWSIDNLPFALIVIVFYVVVQALENTLIVPRLMSRAVNLHPLLVMAGVVVGASLWGIFGILLAAPIIASVLVIVRYAYDRLADRDPFAGPMPEPVSVKEAAGVLSDRLRQWADRIRINQAKSAEGEPAAPPATDQTLERVADRIDEFAARLPTDGEESTQLPFDPYSGAVG